MNSRNENERELIERLVIRYGADVEELKKLQKVVDNLPSDSEPTREEILQAVMRAQTGASPFDSFTSRFFSYIGDSEEYELLSNRDIRKILPLLIVFLTERPVPQLLLDESPPFFRLLEDESKRMKEQIRETENKTK